MTTDPTARIAEIFDGLEQRERERLARAYLLPYDLPTQRITSAKLEAYAEARAAVADLLTTQQAALENIDARTVAGVGLAANLTDEMLEDLRSTWGNTNVAVLRHWRDRVQQPRGVDGGSADSPELTTPANPQEPKP